MSQLAAAEQVRLPTMSRMISSMEADGLVKRVSDGVDGRIVTIRPTNKGRDILRRGRVSRLAAIEAKLATCSVKELEALSDAMATLERLYGSHSTEIQDEDS
jgi:DNA-binding MarR family transcriptional regulator